MKQVVIVDYGLGNIFSIRQALEAVGCEPLVSNNVQHLREADGILLPGVGAFGDAVGKLNEYKLRDVLKDEVSKGKPFLGVCLGLQLLMTKSFEFGEHEGLNIIPGTVNRFPETSEGHELNVPFIGWNHWNKVKEDQSIDGIEDHSKLFLVHSFYVKPDVEADVIATSSYQGFRYPVILRRGKVLGVQGHPEKSGPDGLKIYSNWLKSL
ncbi:MAG TPA: imidazole glycerol phosphate synthase subunit HisH [Bdellovibrio sp.]|nr:imidazole glycerol phosphate synthase subunit HisH [Bdellovibrio sp.]